MCVCWLPGWLAELAGLAVFFFKDIFHRRSRFFFFVNIWRVFMGAHCSGLFVCIGAQYKRTDAQCYAVLIKCGIMYCKCRYTFIIEMKMGEKKTNIFLLNLPPSCSSSSFARFLCFFSTLHPEQLAVAFLNARTFLLIIWLRHYMRISLSSTYINRFAVQLSIFFFGMKEEGKCELVLLLLLWLCIASTTAHNSCSYGRNTNCDKEKQQKLM